MQQPDLIVVDVNGKTLDLVDAIRAGSGPAGTVDPDTPLIVLTSRVDEIHRIRLLDRGGDDVLAKPYSYAELRGSISGFVPYDLSSSRERVKRAKPVLSGRSQASRGGEPGERCLAWRSRTDHASR